VLIVPTNEGMFAYGRGDGEPLSVNDAPAAEATADADSPGRRVLRIGDNGEIELQIDDARVRGRIQLKQLQQIDGRIRIIDGEARIKVNKPDPPQQPDPPPDTE